ncbi:MAG: hypothetical protein ACLT3Y_04445 [Ruminococcus callidus]
MHTTPMQVSRNPAAAFAGVERQTVVVRLFQTAVIGGLELDLFRYLVGEFAVGGVE